MRPLRILARALLLAAGSTVLLATPPKRNPAQADLTARVNTWLPTGAAQVLRFDAPCARWTRLGLSVIPQPQAMGARLVGITSPTRPPAEALALLEPGMSFVPGQPAGALGTVAFVIEKDTTVFLEEQSPVPDLVGVSPFFLTVFAPDAPMNPKLGILQRSGPGCDEDDRSDAHVLDLWPSWPDGGVLDGGQG